MSPRLMRAAAFAVLALLALSVSAGDIYKSTDSQGHTVYSDQPSPGAERINIQSDPSNPKAARARAAQELAELARVDALRQQEAQTKQTAQVARREAQEAREEQCRRARDRHLRISQARRPYRYDANHERVYYSASEIDAERGSAEKAVKELCDDAAFR